MIPTPELGATQAVWRFGLEMAALLAWGVVGWSCGGGALRWVLAVMLPLLAAAAWTMFRVLGDASAAASPPSRYPVRCGFCSNS